VEERLVNHARGCNTAGLTRCLSVRRVALCIAALCLIGLCGCTGSMIEDPDWDDMIIMSPGVFTLIRGDSTFIGFAFWLSESDGEFLDCAPSCVERIEIFSSCWDSYRVESVDLRTVYTCGKWPWQDVGVYCSSNKQYWHIEPIDTCCQGIYTWEVELQSDSTLTAADCLYPFAHQFIDTCFYPPDSTVLAGTEVEFAVRPDVPIGGWEISLFDIHGESALVGEWVRVGYDSKNTFPVIWLEPVAWYSWKVRVWDHNRCNVWEMPVRRWFRTGSTPVGRTASGPDAEPH